MKCLRSQKKLDGPDITTQTHTQLEQALNLPNNEILIQPLSLSHTHTHTQTDRHRHTDTQTHLEQALHQPNNEILILPLMTCSNDQLPIPSQPQQLAWRTGMYVYTYFSPSDYIEKMVAIFFPSDHIGKMVVNWDHSTAFVCGWQRLTKS